MKDHAEEILMVGAVGAGLWLLYKIIQGVQSAGVAAGAALSKAGSTVANVATTAAQIGTAPIVLPLGATAAGLYQFWNWATNANIVESGNVILPDGKTSVPLSNLQVRFNDTYNVATFPLNNVTYVIVPNPDPTGVSYDSNGDYHAITWNQFAATLPS